MPSTVVVAGAGIAGLACARVLLEAGHDVRILERFPAAGGRLASPWVDGRPVDLGAAYFTVSDPGFATVVAAWRERGLVRPWPVPFRVFGPAPGQPGAAAPVRWAAPGGLASLADDLAEGLPVSYGAGLDDLGQAGADRVVLAMPAPQAAAVAPGFAGTAAAQDWQPSLAVALRYPGRPAPGLGGAFVNDHPVLATVCDDGDRRGDGAPVLVAHTTAGFARSERPDAGAVERAVRDVLDLPVEGEVIAARLWPHARPARPDQAPFLQVGGVWLAGDAFGRPRVEAAWLSGLAAGAAIRRAENWKSAPTDDAAR